MSTPTQQRRIETLEAAGFRQDRRFDELDEQVELLRGAVNELSTDVRALRHDMTEGFGGVRAAQQQQAEMLAAIMSHLGMSVPTAPPKTGVE